MDRMDIAARNIQRANRKHLTLPFTEYMRKHMHFDPLQAAHEVRHQRQKSK